MPFNTEVELRRSDVLRTLLIAERVETLSALIAAVCTVSITELFPSDHEWAIEFLPSDHKWAIGFLPSDHKWAIGFLSSDHKWAIEFLPSDHKWAIEFLPSEHKWAIERSMRWAGEL